MPGQNSLKCVSLLLLTFLLAGCFGTGSDVDRWTALKDLKESSGRVVRVTDGDTVSMNVAIRCLVYGRAKYFTRVRYIGIDTPEKNEPFYHSARELNRRLVYGKRVKLVFDKKKVDRGGRLLAYVYVDDIFVNEEIVLRGYARVAEFDIVRPNIKYVNRFKLLEKKAKEQKVGIWSIPQPPEISNYKFVASKSSEVFHVPSCRWVKEIASEKLYFHTYMEAEESGRRSCKVCRPRSE